MSNMNDVMSPDASPGKLNRSSGVRRVNNWPMYIIGGAAMVFLLIMLMVAADRAENQNKPVEKEAEKAGNSSLFAQQIRGIDSDGIIPSKAEPPVVPVLDNVQAQPAALQVVRPTNLDAPPMPPRELPPDVDADELERIRRMKMQQFQDAVRARSTVRVEAPRSSGSSIGAGAGAPVSQQDALARIAAARQRLDEQSRSDPNTAFKARLAELRSAGIGGGGAGGTAQGDSPFLMQAAASTGKDYSQFGNSGNGDRWQLNSAPEAPRSPYELRAGYVIPAMLVSGINSELPGQIMAQVSQAVYDTPTGKHLLVPQGSRLVGAYSSDVSYGQSRVLVAWQRIIFPDGKAMDIGSMPGADAAGYSGMHDQVNNHYVRIFGSALLMSGIVAGISLSQDRASSDSSDRETASSAMSEALGQQLGQVTAQMISKNLNIAPTLEIRPGYRFNVMVTKDLTFSKPYQSFDY
ncbi:MULTISPECIES: TrbI/VirB10 family protein [Pseudomonas]|uniref:Conjugation TrbI family protein n=1 Tax=Pseudomonas putida TaxID=303 RepID=A0A379KFG3_PSEPU|nr:MULTISPECIES: TrbI/VirB10 family protein [Pseudomonas]MBM7398594.1 type IV secretion system protein VirB10 [Pseudomonas sp. M5]RRV44650.1 TrbI/VirB10 family protein [Pseudomonas sp. p106]SUD66692.1 conjugation TrbI family protein [Pseudomonas putida]HDS1755763.1 TrbI/VirB10 family protein [Pseudomonas putida]